MTEWQIFGVVVAMISAFMLVSKPMMDSNTKFVTAITQLTDAVKNLQEANEKTWKHIDTYTPVIIESKRNIEYLEKKVTQIETKIEKIDSKKGE